MFEQFWILSERWGTTSYRRSIERTFESRHRTGPPGGHHEHHHLLRASTAPFAYAASRREPGLPTDCRAGPHLAAVVAGAAHPPGARASHAPVPRSRRRGG